MFLTAVAECEMFFKVFEKIFKAAHCVLGNTIQLSYTNLNGIYQISVNSWQFNTVPHHSRTPAKCIIN